MSIEAASWIPWLPLIGAALCGLCCTRPEWRKAAAPISIASIVASFLITLGVAASVKDWSPDASAGDFTATVGAWIGVGGFQAEWSYFIDKLTLVMLLVVTGIGSLIAIYASGYMAGEKGYARFFAAVSLFIFAMTTLVMADNLLLLFLGWEGVGLASYLLIGYYFDKPSAAAAAKKAFVVNRIGDAGFLLGIFCLYQGFGSIRFTEILPQAAALLHHGHTDNPYLAWAPFFLMLGAFGKSAQIPLYTWLPDAMEGPTPVSALIHAATMVTSGVYLLARLIPVFQLAPGALETIAVVAGLTSLVAALIALNQNDLKKVFAYSTVSQLGYMFLGIAALSTVGAVFPPRDPRLLQGVALPDRRQRDARPGGEPGPAHDVGLGQEAADHQVADACRLPGAGGVPLEQRLLLQGHDPRRRRRQRRRHPGHGLAGSGHRLPHRQLRLPRLVPRVHRRRTLRDGR